MKVWPRNLDVAPRLCLLFFRIHLSTLCMFVTHASGLFHAGLALAPPARRAWPSVLNLDCWAGRGGLRLYVGACAWTSRLYIISSELCLPVLQ